jgi:MarR family multiple gene transcriptional regulator MgrA
MVDRETALAPRIKRISNALDRRRNADMEDMELTSTQGWLLGYLTRHRDRLFTPGDLVRQFGLTHATVSGILQRLEAKGFITIEADDADHRRRCIRLTEKALDCHQNILRHIAETEAMLGAGLTAEEHAALLRLLNRVIAGLDEEPCCCRGKEGAHV